MPADIIERVWRLVHKYGIGWKQVLINTLVLFLVSWLAFWLAEPTNDMVNYQNYFWFFQVSSTTVGYGDFFPKTTGGHIVGFFFLPLAVANTATVIATIAQTFAQIKERYMSGHGTYQITGHVVVVGEDLRRVRKLVGNVENHPVIVVMPSDASDADKDPFAGTKDHDRVKFVSGSLRDADTFIRANVAKATAIILDLSNPDTAYVVADRLREDLTKAHIVVGLSDEHKDGADSLNHLADVTCVPQSATTLMAKEAEAPGAGQILMSLMSDGAGADLYAVRLPDTFPPTGHDQLLAWLNHFHAATLLAVRVNGVVNESPQGISVYAGDTIYYKVCGAALDPAVFANFKAPVVTFA